jgi:hypothetical protein
MTTRFRAIFELDEPATWITQIEEIPQIRTYGRTLGEARE